jgi:hypothetical protein
MLGEQSSFEFSGLVIYTPKINKKWSSFSLPLFTTNLTIGDYSHRYSTQQLQLGMDYKQAFQFGLGIDLTFASENEEYSFSLNIGFFVRITP